MTALRTTSFLFLGLTLGACSAFEAPNTAWAVGTDQKLTKTEDNAPPPQTHPIHEFPKSFRRRWAHVAADCRASGFSAILASSILSIDAKGLSQGEWRPAVISILQSRENPRRISVNVHNTNGKKEWDSMEEFTLLDGGEMVEWRHNQSATRLYRCE